jgi:hypothetical protein
VECGSTFTFTVKDQKFYKEQGFADPKRCRVCREKRKKEVAKNERNY